MGIGYKMQVELFQIIYNILYCNMSTISYSITCGRQLSRWYKNDFQSS